VIWIAMAGLAFGAALIALVTLVLSLRRRLERAACAEHELRGPLAAIDLAVEQVRQGRSGPELAAALESQLDRSRAGLADMAAARTGRRTTAALSPVPLERIARSTASGWRPVAERAGGRLRMDWQAGSVTIAADRGRLAQALGNLLSNAIEHGGGEVRVLGRRVAGVVRIEIANSTRDDGTLGHAASTALERDQEHGAAPDRGRGLGITARAVRESGGTLEISSGADNGVVTALELPLDGR
jgi:signal transduction histidine kinase